MLTINRLIAPIALALALHGFAAGILKAEDHLVLNLWGGTAESDIR